MRNLIPVIARLVKVQQRTLKVLMLLWTAILVVNACLIYVGLGAYFRAETHLRDQVVSYAHLIATHERFDAALAVQRRELETKLSPNRLGASATAVAHGGDQKRALVVHKDLSKLSQTEYYLAVQEIFFPFYASLQLGNAFTASLREGSTILIRFPQSGVVKAGSTDSGKISADILAGLPRGYVEEVDPADGQTKVTAYERFPDANIYATASLPREDAMAAALVIAFASAAASFIACLGGVASTLAMRKSDRDRWDLEESISTIKRMATHDTLTDLPNRKFLNEEFPALLAQQKSLGKELGVIFVDLDHFKSINDTLGHAAGDSLLVQVAKRIKSACAETDIVSRHGGDEFIVVQPLHSDSPDEEIASRCRSILGIFERPFNLNDMMVTSGASLGAAYFPSHGQDFDQVCRHADIALYQSKDKGRGAYSVYHLGMEEAEARARLELHSQILSSISEKSFELLYLPSISFETGKIVSVEALLRWRRPNGDLIFASEIIPLVETNGLIIPVGEIVMEQACAAAAQLRKSGILLVPIAVNISPMQFAQSDVAKSLFKAISSSGVPASSIEIEITEAVLMEDEEIVREKLGKIRALGCKISLDDFGTGYSSLSCLHRFPIQKIKIDRVFAAGLATGESIPLISGVLSMGKAMGLEVCCEGIETREQLSGYKKLGCVQGQGFFMAEPMSLTALISLVNSGESLIETNAPRPIAESKNN